MKKILVIAADQEALGAAPSPHMLRPAHIEILQRAAGADAEIIVATPKEAIAHFGDADAVASFPARMPDIAKLPQAKWLHSFSAGVDRILTPAVATSDVVLSNSRGVHAVPIAEHIVGFMLNHARGFQKTFRNQEKHVWEKDQSLTELCDSTVLIVGLGEIGSQAAKLASAFGAHVRAIVRTPRDVEGFIEHLGTLENLDEELKLADYVVITLPHTDETHHLFTKEKFSVMKPSAFLINIGRGGIINELDLIDALKNNVIAGAGLDVTETEPLPAESPLWDLPNAIITPHHSGLSHKYMDRAIELLCRNIKAYLAGEKLPTQVDKQLGY